MQTIYEIQNTENIIFVQEVKNNNYNQLFNNHT